MRRFLTTIVCLLPVFALAIPNLSFVMTSPGANVTSEGNNTYKITLFRVSPYLSYITQRPGRSVGTTSMQDFIQSWGVGGRDSFARNNPNVVIYAGISNGSNNQAGRFVAGTLTKIQYDIASEQAFATIQLLPGQAFSTTNPSMQNLMIIIN